MSMNDDSLSDSDRICITMIALEMWRARHPDAKGKNGESIQFVNLNATFGGGDLWTSCVHNAIGIHRMTIAICTGK